MLYALDAVDGEVVVEGWTRGTGTTILDRMRELRGLVGGFLVTFVEREGRLDGLANNAGIAGPFPSTFETETVEQWRRMLSINVEGVFLGCKYAVPAMRKSGGGSIVNISSVAAITGSGSSIAYGAAKAALDTMSLSLARVLGPEIRVMTVSPAAGRCGT